MSRFVKAETERVDLGDGDFVVIRSRFKAADRMAITDATLKIAPRSESARTVGTNGNAAGADVEMQWLVGSNMLATVCVGIVEWGGPGFIEDDGSVRPVTEENIRELDDDTFQTILKALQERNPRPSAAATASP